MNYRVNFDRSYTYISGDDETEPDGHNVFESFGEAKEAALEYLSDEIEGLRQAVKSVKMQRKTEIEIE
jgi:hypothetical protein